MIYIASIVIAVIGGLIFAGWLLWECIEPETILGWIFSAIVSLAISAFCGFLFVMGAVGLGNIFLEKEIKLVSETRLDLRALDSGSEVTGRFYIGSGYINQNKVLEYISESEDGGLRVSSTPADMSVLYEREGEDPKLIIRHYEQVNAWLAPEPVATFDNYEFIIPKGSVKDNYAVGVGK